MVIVKLLSELYITITIMTANQDNFLRCDSIVITVANNSTPSFSTSWLVLFEMPRTYTLTHSRDFFLVIDFLGTLNQRYFSEDGVDYVIVGDESQLKPKEEEKKEEAPKAKDDSGDAQNAIEVHEEDSIMEVTNGAGGEGRKMMHQYRFWAE